MKEAARAGLSHRSMRPSSVGWEGHEKMWGGSCVAPLQLGQSGSRGRWGIRGGGSVGGSGRGGIQTGLRRGRRREKEGMEERKAATFRGRHQRLAGGGLGPAVEPTLAAFATLAWLRWAGRGSGSSGGPGGHEKFSSPDSKTESNFRIPYL